MKRHKSDERMTSIPIDIFIVKYYNGKELYFVYNFHGPTLAEMTGYRRDVPLYAQMNLYTLQNEPKRLQDEEWLECIASLTKDEILYNRDMPWLRLFIRKLLEDTLNELLWLHEDGFVLGGELVLQHLLWL